MAIVLTDSQIANLGIVTREAKGAELTHAEMDSNLMTELDIIAFLDVAKQNILEYASILVAPPIPAIGQSITVSPIEGYCAVKIRGENYTVGNNIEWTGKGQAFLYKDNFDSSQTSSPAFLSSGCEYLVVQSDVAIDVSVSPANA